MSEVQVYRSQATSGLRTRNAPMLISHFFRRKPHFVPALMLTLCLISSALPRPSRTASDDGGAATVTARVEGRAKDGRKNSGYETNQPPADAREEAPARPGDLDIKRRTTTLPPSRLVNHLHPSATATVIQPASPSFLSPLIHKVTVSHTADF